jgi:hypothetical protein
MHRPDAVNTSTVGNGLESHYRVLPGLIFIFIAAYIIILKGLVHLAPLEDVDFVVRLLLTLAASTEVDRVRELIILVCL